MIYSVDMHIVFNRSKTKKRKAIFNSVLLMESYRENGKVKKRTIANLSKCSDAEINALQLALKNKDNLAVLKSIEDVNLQQDKSMGSVWVIKQIADRLHLDKVLGNSFSGKLALWQVISRIIKQGSRLGATRLADSYNLADVLDMPKGFDENDLYENLAWISDNQLAMEKKLFKLRKNNSLKQLFLYDVTSSYLEGMHNELGDYGYNRDKKKGKKQIVIGLLCDDQGSPVAVEVFQGNTADVSTVPNQIKKLAEEFGCNQVTLVGDRAMLKQVNINILPQEFNYITAITKAQIEKLINQGDIQLELFQEEVCEVEVDKIRYILRKNICRAQSIRDNRQDKQKSVEQLIEKLNLYLANHPLAKVDTAIKKINQKLAKLKIENWLKVDVKARELSLITDQEALTKEEVLDGCYAIKTDVSQDISDAETIHARYKDLAMVESAFRYCKTSLLEVRPVFVRKAKSTKGHVFVVMLAYLIIQQLKKAWAKQNLTVEEGIDHLSKICSIKVNITGHFSMLKIPMPDIINQKLLNSLNLTLPKILPKSNVNVVTRKSIKKIPKSQ